MDIITIAVRMMPLFFIMAAGYIAYKTKIMDEQSNVRFTKTVLNIAIPSQIIMTFVSGRGEVTGSEILVTFGVTFLTYALFMALAAVFIWVMKIPKEQRGTYAFMTMFSNTGFMGYPVITAIFGEHAMIYAVIVNIVFNLLAFSVGIMMIGGGKSVRFHPRQLLNMPLMASVLAIVLYLTGVTLPPVVETTMEYLGSLTTPLAMLVLGSIIASMQVRELLDDWKIYVFTAFRLFAIPLAVYALLYVCPLENKLMTGTQIILAAMPAATNSTMMAIEYEGDVRLASKGVFFSTVLSMLTIPLVAVFCQ